MKLKEILSVCISFNFILVNYVHETKTFDFFPLHSPKSHKINVNL